MRAAICYTETMRIQILLNQCERESFLHGYKPGHRANLMRVFDGDKGIPPTTTTEVLENIYRENQHGVGTPWYTDARSLSVGDVICIGESAWAVDKVGFKALEDFEVPS